MKVSVCMANASSANVLIYSEHNIRQLKNVSSFLFVASEAASKTLVVNNLSFNATEEVLQSTFEKAVSIRIPQRDGRPKG